MRRFVGWLSLAVAVIGIDQVTKILIRGSMALGQGVEVTSFFELLYVMNPGASFSFLAGAGGWQRWFFLVLALGICSWLTVMLKRQAAEKLAPLAFALIIGGALGNVIDRVLYGAVVDFLYFHLGAHDFPAFNVADSAISLGVFLMLLEQFLSGKKAAPHLR